MQAYSMQQYTLAGRSRIWCLSWQSRSLLRPLLKGICLCVHFSLFTPTRLLALSYTLHVIADARWAVSFRAREWRPPLKWCPACMISGGCPPSWRMWRPMLRCMLISWTSLTASSGERMAQRCSQRLSRSSQVGDFIHIIASVSIRTISMLVISWSTSFFNAACPHCIATLSTFRSAHLLLARIVHPFIPYRALTKHFLKHMVSQNTPKYYSDQGTFPDFLCRWAHPATHFADGLLCGRIPGNHCCMLGSPAKPHLGCALHHLRLTQCGQCCFCRGLQVSALLYFLGEHSWDSPSVPFPTRSPPCTCA